MEIREADVFWHLATGRWILESGTIAATDPFSHLTKGMTWVNHEWLFQVLLRLVQVSGGMAALYAVKALLYTAAIALPAWFSVARASTAALLGSAALALFAALPFSEYRPLMGSLVLFALAAEGGRRAAAGHKAPLYWLPLLFIFWASFHATFLLGLVALGCHAALPGEKTARRRAILVGLLAACAAATLLNPYGPGVWTVPAKVGGSQLFMSANEEWRPPDASAEYWPFYLSLPLLAGGIALLGKRALSADMLLAVLLAVASFKSRRMIPWYAVGALPALALCLSTLGGQMPQPGGRFRSFASSLLLSLLLAAGTAWAHYTLSPHALVVRSPDGLPFFAGAFPDQTVKTLKQFAPGGNLFNDYNHGGYLHYTAGPGWKVFIDGRNDLYGEKLTLLYNALALGHESWPQVFNKTGVDAALVSYAICTHRPNIALALAEDPQWALVDFDDAAMLYVRREKAPADWLRGREYQAVKPMLFYEEQAPVHQEENRFPLFVQELRRRTAQERSRIAEQMLAEALLDARQPHEALQVLNRTDYHFGPDPASREIRLRLPGEFTGASR